MRLRKMKGLRQDAHEIVAGVREYYVALRVLKKRENNGSGLGLVRVIGFGSTRRGSGQGSQGLGPTKYEASRVGLTLGVAFTENKRGGGRFNPFRAPKSLHILNSQAKLSPKGNCSCEEAELGLQKN